MNWKLAIPYLVFALTVIAVIDYNMGERAQALNGYEIARRTFVAPLGIDAPVRSDHYIIKQEAFGSLALAWAWLLYLIWAAVLARFLYFVTRRFHKKKRSAEEAFFQEGDDL